jgi:hypothetical protein
LQARKEECDRDSGEDLEETFDPEMHDPPAPIFGRDQMAVLAVHQTGCIEERDGD